MEQKLKRHRRQMQTFKESFNLLTEKKLGLPKGEKVAKELNKLGKNKNVTAVITNKNVLYVNGDKLDKFKSLKDAEKALKDFLKVMDL